MFDEQVVAQETTEEPVIRELHLSLQMLVSRTPPLVLLISNQRRSPVQLHNKGLTHHMLLSTKPSLSKLNSLHK